LSDAFSDIGSVGERRKKQQEVKLEKKPEAKRPGTSASYLKSLKTTRCGYKVNMAVMEDGKIDAVVRIKREQGKS